MIKIYGKPDCLFCTKAKNLCDNYNLTYEYYEIGTDISREVLLEEFPNARTVPLIVISGTKIGGYDQLLAYLEETGYNGTGHTL